MGIFDHNNYRSYLRAHISSLPQKGRGELSKIAKYLKVNTTWISQIMSGSQDFNQEQAYSLSLYLGHIELEMEYFSLLIQIERAGTVELKAHLRKKIETTKAESLKLSRRVHYAKKLSDQERSVFYSSWIFSAVHIFTSLNDKSVTLDEIAQRFDLTKVKASEIVQFLLMAGVITENQGDSFWGCKAPLSNKAHPIY